MPFCIQFNNIRDFWLPHLDPLVFSLFSSGKGSKEKKKTNHQEVKGLNELPFDVQLKSVGYILYPIVEMSRYIVIITVLLYNRAAFSSSQQQAEVCSHLQNFINERSIQYLARHVYRRLCIIKTVYTRIYVLNISYPCINVFFFFLFSIFFLPTLYVN